MSSHVSEICIAMRSDLQISAALWNKKSICSVKQSSTYYNR